MNADRDWRTLDLSSGRRSLLEASAGTGKTWTISVLYLRLLLEQGLSPRQIVVTTFTNPAAEELRERLRARLMWAVAYASGRKCLPPDSAALDVLWLQVRWLESPDVQQADARKLQVALVELDMAPITTLHGLCQRILSDHPFASGALFNGGELISGAMLLDELAKDLRRRLLQGDPQQDELIQLQHSAGLQPNAQTLKRILGQLLMPGSTIRTFTEDELDRLLPKDRAQEFRDLVGCFGKTIKLGKAFESLADILENRETAVPGGSDLESVLSSAPALTGVLKHSKDDPRLPVAADFALAIAQSGVLHFKTLRFWAAVADWAKDQAKLRLAARSQRSFDALLTDVHAALHGDAGRALADTLYAAWPVALVDEFQDTDGIQYGILDAIYRQSDASMRGHLVMIGDPKQAIYRFRGGDIRAYQRAAADVPEDGRISLDTNRRSSRTYVAAMNAWYALCGTALSTHDAEDGVHYHPVHASDRNDATPYTIAGEPCDRPLQFYAAADPDKGSAAVRTQLALTDCANRIQHMLQSGEHAIGSRPLQPADIAVLLPAHHQVSQLRDLLQSRGVPCVSTSRSSVFAGATARELQIILFAVAHADQAGALRAAMATRLWGASFAAVSAMNGDAARWQAAVRVFHQWQALWQQRGIQAVVDALIARIAAVQLDCVGGERTLTDLRHLGELLQTRMDECNGAEELLVWFAAQREDGGDDAEDAADNRQLRIESDAARVHLMTLHASKGLEFPIVFLPLMWAHGEKRESGLQQAGDTADGMRLWQVGETAERTALQDLQDERFRVLYVAMTRAIHACHVFVLPPGRGSSARSTKPLSGTARSALDVSVARLQERADWKTGIDHAEGIAWHEDWQPPEASTAMPESADEGAHRSAREMPDPPQGPLPFKHSFSTLTKFDVLSPVEDSAAIDERIDFAENDTATSVTATASPELPHPELSALMDVAGTDFGNAVHAIFEHREPLRGLLEQKALIRRCLAENNVQYRDGDPERLVDNLADRLQAVLDTPLGPDGMRLGVLPRSELRAEMEFNYVLGHADIGRLRQVCAAHGDANLVPVPSRRLAGLMNGKIDLVFRHDGRFHVLDYKSNRLGSRLSDYGPAALQAAMDSHHYRFQALLYAVAVDRYLAQRIADYDRSRHLGDCFYLFVRAVGLDGTAGIWRHRFNEALMTDVQAVLAGMPAVQEAG
ncbi:UvrD-helicase domain-containing protein [Arenimonas sp. GDDSR-1]|uniref:UvrD-helicase domain-containing protein n=1 Tax=Arenimonas sp. GDDSR-1 TaxID=2950125 RepID=UPI002612824A|nr:UvrD-helicase domain-containing protein [Arenimonas sp. GDDSR-1]